MSSLGWAHPGRLAWKYGFVLKFLWFTETHWLILISGFGFAWHRMDYHTGTGFSTSTAQSQKISEGQEAWEITVSEISPEASTAGTPKSGRHSNVVDPKTGNGHCWSVDWVTEVCTSHFAGNDAIASRKYRWVSPAGWRNSSRPRGGPRFLGKRDDPDCGICQEIRVPDVRLLHQHRGAGEYQWQFAALRTLPCHGQVSGSPQVPGGKLPQKDVENPWGNHRKMIYRRINHGCFVVFSCLFKWSCILFMVIV